MQASHDQGSLKLCIGAETEYTLSYEGVFKDGQVACVFDSDKCWSLQLSWSREQEKYQLSIDGKNFAQLPTVPGSLAYQDTSDTLTGRIRLNSETILDGLLCTPFTPSQVQSLIDMRLEGAEVDSLAIENLDCKPQVASQLLNLLVRQRTSSTTGLKELTLSNF